MIIVSARERQVDDIWIRIGGEVGRTVGWKLHLSSVPVEADRLLARVIPVLRAEDLSFKFCRSPEVLVALNSAELGESQVGKFCTIYPRTDTQAVRLARRLVGVTAGFHGPVIPTDLPLGGVVYARYGEIEPVVKKDRLGLVRSYIDCGSALVEDGRPVPFAAPPGGNPFEGIAVMPVEAGADRNIAGRYRVVDVVKPKVTGSLFVAIDCLSVHGPSLCAVKQGRAHTFSDQWGRDRRDRLRHEVAVSARLTGIPDAVGAHDYVEWDGDGYLSRPFVEGASVQEWALDKLRWGKFSRLGPSGRAAFFEVGAGIAHAVQKVHERSIVHRDLSPSNVLITEGGRALLIDFELAFVLGDDSPPFLTGTEGFMSSNQESKGAPEIADDLYALGALLIVLFTGFDPRRYAGWPDGGGAARMAAWTGIDAPDLTRLIGCALGPAETRPGAAEMAAALERAAAQTRRALTPRQPQKISAAGRVLALACAGLRSRDLTDPVTGLPVAAPSDQSASGPFELRADIHRGLSGFVYLIAEAAATGWRDEWARDAARRSLVWLLQTRPPDALPGLFFGTAGWAVALDTARAAGLFTAPGEWPTLIDDLLSGPLDWLDLTHGAAGQGLAALHLGRLNRARAAGDFLASCQRPDGSWVAPEGVPGLTGHTLPGFAHGVAGIVFFLATLDAISPDPAIDDAWRRGADWLVTAGRSGPGGSLDWDYSDIDTAHWRWWCHGAPGIAFTFLRCAESTGESSFERLAACALGSIPAGYQSANLTQCHGMAGLGETLLEGWRVLGDKRWLAESRRIGGLLETMTVQVSGGVAWMAENLYRPTADLMVGGGGVLHFLLRLENQHELPPPLLAPLDMLRRRHNAGG